MSKSYRKNPIIGYTDGSDKKDKRLANRKFRRKSKRDYENAPVDLNEVSDVWSFTKDGKAYVRDLKEKYMRK